MKTQTTFFVNRSDEKDQNVNTGKCCNLVLVEQETGKWLEICGDWFFLGGVECDYIHPYDGFRGWGDQDVQVHRMGSSWGFQREQLRDDDVLGASGTSQLLVQLVEPCSGFGEHCVKPADKGESYRLLRSLIRMGKWGGDPFSVRRMVECIAESDNDSLRDIRHLCRDVIYNETHAGMRAFSVFVLGELAPHDHMSVDTIAVMVADEILHLEVIPALFGSHSYFAAREVALMLTTLSPSAASRLCDMGLRQWLKYYVTNFKNYNK